MSDTIPQEFVMPRPSRTDELEVDDEDRRLRAELVQKDMPAVFHVRATAARRHTTQAFQGLQVELDEGSVIVSDPLGAAYGVGASLGEAMAQWEAQAREHYE